MAPMPSRTDKRILEVGKLADLVILDQNPLKVRSDEYYRYPYSKNDGGR